MNITRIPKDMKIIINNIVDQTLKN